MSRKWINYNFIEPDYFSLGSTNLTENDEVYNNTLWKANYSSNQFANFKTIPKAPNCNLINNISTCTICRPYDGNYFTTSNYNHPLNVNHPNNRFQMINCGSGIKSRLNKCDLSINKNKNETFRNVDEIDMPLENDTTNDIYEKYAPIPLHKNIYQNSRYCHAKCDWIYPVNRSDNVIRPKTIQNAVCHNMCCKGGKQMQKMVTTPWDEIM
jgi:hypothetical protein